MRHRWALRLLMLFNSCIFYAPVALLVRTEQGLSYSDVFLLQAILSAALLLFEIPSGFLADKIGYRHAIVSALCAAAAARFLLVIANSFLIFLIEALTEAFSFAMMSGSVESYLLKQSSTEDQALQLSLVNRFGTIGFIASTLLFAPLYIFGQMRLLLLLTLFCSLLALTCGILLPEEQDVAEASSASHRSTVKESTQIIWRMAHDVKGRSLLVLTGALGIAQLSVNFFYVDRLSAAAVPEEWMTAIILLYSALEIPLPRILAMKSVKEAPSRLWWCCLTMASMFCFIISFAIGARFMMLTCMVLLPPLLSLLEYLTYSFKQAWIIRQGLDSRLALVFSLFGLVSDALELFFLLLASVVSNHQVFPLFASVGFLLLICGVYAGSVLYDPMRQGGNSA